HRPAGVPERPFAVPMEAVRPSSRGGVRRRLDRGQHKEVVVKLVRIWLGLVLVALGVLGLLDTAGVAEFGATAGRWWPVAVIGLGLTAMWSQRRVSFGPSLVTVAGFVLLAGQLQWTQKTLFWPALLLVAGVVVLAGLRPRRTRPQPRTESLALLGGARTVDRSEHFTHADVSAVLGGSALDLRHAHIDDQATVDAFAFCGGVDVLVPEDWRVQIGGLPILGGYEDKTADDAAPPDDAPVLKVNATALLGGVKVAHEPS
ncbi:LiaF transmembrane domain-containing protein, partial [Amycolatopsis sp. NPDC051903]|uniref:LiaF transmembrane domain-containing protein n=1 Tax=Amycolatopsis sp. NPDC051903 TaxID=3363936 RepID=UPI0037AC1A24